MQNHSLFLTVSITQWAQGINIASTALICVYLASALKKPSRGEKKTESFFSPPSPWVCTYPHRSYVCSCSCVPVAICCNSLMSVLTVQALTDRTNSMVDKVPIPK